MSKLDLAWVCSREKCLKSYQLFLFWVSTTRLLCESLLHFWGNSVALHQMNPNERESRLSFICYVMFKRIKLLKRCELYSLCSLVGPYHVFWKLVIFISKGILGLIFIIFEGSYMRYFHLTTFKRFLITSFLHLTRIN